LRNGVSLRYETFSVRSICNAGKELTLCLLALWKQVTHSLTVVFFSRTYFSSDKVTDPGKKPSSTGREGAWDTRERHGENGSSHVNVDVCGRLYEVRYAEKKFVLERVAQVLIKFSSSPDDYRIISRL
jgi:hypothetical protein